MAMDEWFQASVGEIVKGAEDPAYNEPQHPVDYDPLHLREWGAKQHAAAAARQKITVPAYMVAQEQQRQRLARAKTLGYALLVVGGVVLLVVGGVVYAGWKAVGALAAA